MSDTAAKRQAPPGWFIDAVMPIWRARAVAAGRSAAMTAFLNTPDPRPPTLPPLVEEQLRREGDRLVSSIDSFVAEFAIKAADVPLVMGAMATFLQEVAPLLANAAVDAARARWKDQFDALADPRSGPLMRLVLDALGPEGPLARSQGEAP